MGTGKLVEIWLTRLTELAHPRILLADQMCLHLRSDDCRPSLLSSRCILVSE